MLAEIGEEACIAPRTVRAATSLQQPLTWQAKSSRFCESFAARPHAFAKLRRIYQKMPHTVRTAHAEEPQMPNTPSLRQYLADALLEVWQGSFHLVAAKASYTKDRASHRAWGHPIYLRCMVQVSYILNLCDQSVLCFNRP